MLKAAQAWASLASPGTPRAPGSVCCATLINHHESWPGGCVYPARLGASPGAATSVELGMPKPHREAAAWGGRGGALWMARVHAWGDRGAPWWAGAPGRGRLGLLLVSDRGDGVPRLWEPVFRCPPPQPGLRVPLNPWTVAAHQLLPSSSAASAPPVARLSGGLSQQLPWAWPLPGSGKGGQPQWGPQLLEVGRGLPGPWNWALSPPGCQPWGPAPACWGYPHPALHAPLACGHRPLRAGAVPTRTGVWFGRVHWHAEARACGEGSAVLLGVA